MRCIWPSVLARIVSLPDKTVLRCAGLPAVADADAHTLILGSMPGAASLAAQSYYAHPRNAFWPIMGALFGAAPALPYGERLAILRRHGLALWDVMAECERSGSLDAAIIKQSVVANDFSAFFAVHRKIERIFFNGAAAETAFRRHVLPALQAQPLRLLRLPSSSPAHAALSHTDKLAAWAVIRDAGK